MADGVGRVVRNRPRLLAIHCLGYPLLAGSAAEQVHTAFSCVWSIKLDILENGKLPNSAK